MNNIISILSHITKNRLLKPVTSKNIKELKQNLTLLLTEVHTETE